MNEVVSEEMRRELRKRGHKIETTDEPVGYPVMLYVDPATGIQYAAGDPKAWRHAAVVEVLPKTEGGQK